MGGVVSQIGTSIGIGDKLLSSPRADDSPIQAELTQQGKAKRSELDVLLRGSDISPEDVTRFRDRLKSLKGNPTEVLAGLGSIESELRGVLDPEGDAFKLNERKNISKKRLADSPGLRAQTSLTSAQPILTSLTGGGVGGPVGR